jgi:hypothetical protein
MTTDNAASAEAVEPPDEEGFHFAETDPSQRFGRVSEVPGWGIGPSPRSRLGSFGGRVPAALPWVHATPSHQFGP